MKLPLRRVRPLSKLGLFWLGRNLALPSDGRRTARQARKVRRALCVDVRRVVKEQVSAPTRNGRLDCRQTGGGTQH